MSRKQKVKKKKGGKLKSAESLVLQDMKKKGGRIYFLDVHTFKVQKLFDNEKNFSYLEM